MLISIRLICNLPSQIFFCIEPTIETWWFFYLCSMKYCNVRLWIRHARWWMASIAKYCTESISASKAWIFICWKHALIRMMNRLHGRFPIFFCFYLLYPYRVSFLFFQFLISFVIEFLHVFFLQNSVVFYQFSTFCYCWHFGEFDNVEYKGRFSQEPQLFLDEKFFHFIWPFKIDPKA